MPTHKIDPSRLIQILPTSAKVKYKDIFDLRELYIALRYWMEEYGWFSENNNLVPDFDRYETYYLEKTDPGGSKEIRIEWRMFKNAPNSKQLKYYLDLNYQLYGIKSTEIIRDGMKFKAHKGEVELEISAFIEKLYEPRFEKNWFLKPFMNIFTDKVFDLQEKEKELYQEVYILQNFIKQWFKLKRYLPYEETKLFHGSFAWPSHHKEEGA